MPRTPLYLPKASLPPAGAPAVLQLPELDPVLLAVADDGDVVVLGTVISVDRPISVATILAVAALKDTRPKNESFNMARNYVKMKHMIKMIDSQALSKPR